MPNVAPSTRLSSGVVIVSLLNRKLRFLLLRAYRNWDFPKGLVEPGEEPIEAAIREVREETGLVIEPVALAGYRQVIARDAEGRIERHFVILPFAARYLGGEISLNAELAEAAWLWPADVSALNTTEGLADIVAAARARIAAL